FMVMDLDETKTLLQKEISLDAYIIYVDEEGILQEYLTDGFAKVIVE
ncbi:MAG: FAD:protein FMN transferase, partial [Flavobacteriales bacterium]|nr:FAD:protein FMN transferase [Flavobacteriales bacterium]